jgi:hypothetical protein
MSAPNRKVYIKQWWASRRRKYNIGLVIAGIVAFVLYAIAGSYLMDDADFEISLFTIFGQGVGYLLMMVVANFAYRLGPYVDEHYNVLDDERFRRRLYRLGYWFSFGLPFLVPLLVVLEYLFK